MTYWTWKKCPVDDLKTEQRIALNELDNQKLHQNGVKMSVHENGAISEQQPHEESLLPGYYLLKPPYTLYY